MKILISIFLIMVFNTINTRVITKKQASNQQKERQLEDEAKIIQDLYQNRAKNQHKVENMPKFYRNSMKQRNLRLKNLSKKYFAQEKKWLQQQQNRVLLTKEQKRRILQENIQLEKIFNHKNNLHQQERNLAQNKLPGEKKEPKKEESAHQSQTEIKVETHKHDHNKPKVQKPQKIAIKRIKQKHTIQSLFYKARNNFQKLAGLYDHNQVDNPQLIIRYKENPEVNLKNTFHYIQNTNDLMEYYIKNYILTKNVIDAYNKYSAKSNNKNYGDSEDMLKFYVSHQNNIFIRKYEKNFYVLLKKIYGILKEKNDDILFLCRSNTTQNIFKEDVDNYIKLIEFIQKYYIYLKNISQNHFHHLDFDNEINKYEKSSYETDFDHYKIEHKDFKINQTQRDKVPVQIMFQDVDEEDQKINQNDPEAYIKQKMLRIPESLNNNHQMRYDQQMLEQQKFDDYMIVDNKQQTSMSPLSNKSGTVDDSYANQNELNKDSINLEHPNDEPFNNFDAKLEQAKVNYALNANQDLSQLQNYRESNKKFNPKIPLNKVYGVNYNEQQLEDQINKDSGINQDGSLRDEEIAIIKAPEVLEKDTRLGPVFQYDGYGEDIRTRISGVKKFQNKQSVDQFQEMYKVFRNSNQVPFQEIKTHIDSYGNRQRRLINQKMFNPPKGYQLRLPLRNDLAYLLQDNDETKSIDKLRKILPQLSDGDKSLFDGNKQNKWEKKADKVFRQLLKI